VITLAHPPDGAILYAESLVVQGTLQGSSQRFDVEIIGLDGATLAAATVDAQPGSWSVEIPHNYGGDPIEATVQIMPQVGTAPFDTATVLLRPLAERPPGISGSVLSPPAEATVGGDAIPVIGRASGVQGVTVALLDEIGTPISEVILPLTNPYRVDDLPWQADLPTEGYTGRGTIVVTIGEEALRVPVIVTDAAG
jgi:hypothetical protein